MDFDEETLQRQNLGPTLGGRQTKRELRNGTTENLTSSKTLDGTSQIQSKLLTNLKKRKIVRLQIVISGMSHRVLKVKSLRADVTIL